MAAGTPRTEAVVQSAEGTGVTEDQLVAQLKYQLGVGPDPRAPLPPLLTTVQAAPLNRLLLLTGKGLGLGIGLGLGQGEEGRELVRELERLGRQIEYLVGDLN